MYHDHHLHPLGYATLVNGLELMDATDLDEVMERVTAHGERVEGPIIGQRLNDEGLKELRLPTAGDIDDVVPDRPVLLYRYCGHIAIANSAAMALAGVDSDTPDPRGGAFDRDTSGRPNGILREAAVTAVSASMDAITPAPSDEAILTALATLPAMGIGSITGMVSMDEPIWCGVAHELEALIRIAPQLPLTIDVLVITGKPESLVAAKDRLDRAEGPVRFAGWKGFSDGSLGGHTAAMYEPFSDKPETRGIVTLDHEHARVMGETSAAHGGAVAIHAIGDRANDIVLDVFADLISAGVEPEKLRVEHASVLAPPTVERMSRLGVTASIQPAFLASEQTWLEKRLGPDRMHKAYPFRSLLEAGVPLLGGSDSPVELPEPETGIRAAVDRHGISPDEALTREQAEALFAPPAA
jgi:predicted amidohydrolase YtcJ